MKKENEKILKLTNKEAYALLAMLEMAGYNDYEENSISKTVYDKLNKQIEQ